MNPETESEIRAEWGKAKQRPGAEGGPFIASGVVYADHDRLRRESETVFARTWVPAARVVDFSKTGDFQTFDLAGTPILLVRDEAGRMQALLNVCSHRGSQVVRDQSGNRDQFVCPYHQFIYAHDGSLCSQLEPASFDQEQDMSLPKLDTEIWGGWVWVRKQSGPQTLLEFLGSELQGELEEWPFDGLACFGTSEVQGAFDWKIGVEAFLESLHLPAIHPRTAHPLLDYARTAQKGLGQHSRMSTPFRSKAAYAPEGVLGAAALASGVRPFPKLNSVQLESNLSYLLFPCTILNLLPTHATVFQILPTGVGQCRLTQSLLAAPPKTAKERGYIESLKPGYDRLLTEDVDNLTWIQRGLANGDRPHLKLGSHERRILHFREQLAQWETM